VSILSLKKHIGLAEREILALVYGYYIFPKPSVHGFPTVVDPAIATVGTSFNPLPCQALHGYGVTSAHRVKVEVGANGPANAPPSGAAAAAPPVGAIYQAAYYSVFHISIFLGTFWRGFRGVCAVFNVRGLVCGCVNRAWKFTPHVRVMFLENKRAKTHMTQVWLNTARIKHARAIGLGEGLGPTWP
jgi:hypothetical protein